jgi:hypothetical protein
LNHPSCRNHQKYEPTASNLSALQTSEHKALPSSVISAQPLSQAAQVPAAAINDWQAACRAPEQSRHVDHVLHLGRHPSLLGNIANGLQLAIWQEHAAAAAAAAAGNMIWETVI